MATAYRIKLGDHNIGDCDVEPYASFKGKIHFVPAVPLLIKEVQRRCASQKITPVKCKNYPKTKLLEWLRQYPVNDPVDVAFLLKEESKLRKVFTEAKQEKEKNLLMTKESNKKTKPWNQNDPFICLYHCLIDDKVKEAFLKKDDAVNRQQLDAMRTSKRPLNWEELARD